MQFVVLARHPLELQLRGHRHSSSSGPMHVSELLHAAQSHHPTSLTTVSLPVAKGLTVGRVGRELCHWCQPGHVLFGRRASSADYAKQPSSALVCPLSGWCCLSPGGCQHVHRQPERLPRSICSKFSVDARPALVALRKLTGVNKTIGHLFCSWWCFQPPANKTVTGATDFFLPVNLVA